MKTKNHLDTSRFGEMALYKHYKKSGMVILKDHSGRRLFQTYWEYLLFAAFIILIFTFIIGNALCIILVSLSVAAIFAAGIVTGIKDFSGAKSVATFLNTLSDNELRELEREFNESKDRIGRAVLSKNYIVSSGFIAPYTRLYSIRIYDYIDRSGGRKSLYRGPIKYLSFEVVGNDGKVLRVHMGFRLPEYLSNDDIEALIDKIAARCPQKLIRRG